MTDPTPMSKEMADHTSATTLKRRVASLERRLARHEEFRAQAAVHVPNLIGFHPYAPQHKDAVSWWNECNSSVELSAPPPKEGGQ